MPANGLKIGSSKEGAGSNPPGTNHFNKLQRIMIFA
jgi:hypothetical protein